MAWPPEVYEEIGRLNDLGYDALQIALAMDKDREQIRGALFRMRAKKPEVQWIGEFEDVDKRTLANESAGKPESIIRPLNYTAGGVAQYGR